MDYRGAKIGDAPRDTEAEIQNSASHKCCLQTHKIYMPSFIDIGPAVSEPLGFKKC